MTAGEFTAWRKHLGLNGREAADALGVSKNTITAYEHCAPMQVQVVVRALSIVGAYFSQARAA